MTFAEMSLPNDEDFCRFQLRGLRLDDSLPCTLNSCHDHMVNVDCLGMVTSPTLLFVSP
jgi:hypothetical protein